MLMYFWKEDMGQVIVRSDFKKNGGKQWKQLVVESALSSFSSKAIIPYLLVIHAFGGCDTTSAIHGKGKASPLHLLQKSKTARELCNVFLNPSSSQDEIGRTGIQFFVLLYSGKATDTLTDL